MLKPKSSQLSFYGDHIYDRVIPDDHFLKQLERAVISASLMTFARMPVILMLADQHTNLRCLRCTFSSFSTISLTAE